MPAGHSQIPPYPGKVFFRYPQKINPLSAGQFDHSDVVFGGGPGDPHQFFRTGHSAINTRNNRECAVVLNVGMNPVVDETGIPLIFVSFRPDGLQKRRQSRLALRIFPARGQLLKNRTDRFQSSGLDLGGKFGFLQRHTRDIIVFPRIIGNIPQNSFNQLSNGPAARTAPGSGPCLGTDGGGTAAIVLEDGVGDFFLADAVTIANLGGLRQVFHLKERCSGRRAKKDLGAILRQFHLASVQPHQIIREGCIAQQNSSVNPIVTNNHLFVNAAAWVTVDNDFILRQTRLFFSQGGQLNAHDFEFGACLRSRVFGVDTAAGDDIRNHLGLLPDGFHKAIHNAAVFDAFPQSKDVRIACPQLIVTDDPPVDLERRMDSQFRDGTGAGADNHHIRCHQSSIFEYKGRRLAVFAQNPCCHSIHKHMKPHSFHNILEHPRRLLIQLRRHELRGGLNDRHVQIMSHQPPRRLQSQQPSADHNGLTAILRVLPNAPAVVNGTKKKCPGTAKPFDRGNERTGPRGQDKKIIRFLQKHCVPRLIGNRAVGRQSRRHALDKNIFPAAVNAHNLDTGIKRDVVFTIPGQRMSDDLLGALRLVQDIAQKDTVVIAVRFRPEHDNLE